MENNHIFMPDKCHGNCCCRLCMPKSTYEMDKERALKLSKNQEDLPIITKM